MAAPVLANRPSDHPRLVVVGAGRRFTSGLTYYTAYLVNHLSKRYDVTALLVRRMLPRRLYPGAARVGQPMTSVAISHPVRVVESLDWHVMPGIVPAVVALLRARPVAVVFQWWTGTVLHLYLILALVARLRRASIVIEFHETLDPAETGMSFAAGYVRLVAPLFMRLADGYIAHSSADRAELRRRYRLRRPFAVTPHGPYYERPARPAKPLRVAPPGDINVLFFGLVRPYKGLDVLVEAFERLADTDDRIWLTIVGETWEGWTAPIDAARASRHARRIHVLNRYVTDAEVDAAFAGADVVALPYRRSSGSGPLHTAMARGLPVVVSDVGALREAVEGYAGAVTVPPDDSAALAAGITQAAGLAARRPFTDPHSWDRTVAVYGALLDRIDARARAHAAGPP